MSASHPNSKIVICLFHIFKNYGGFGSGHFVMTMLKKLKDQKSFLTFFDDKAHFFTLFYTYFPAILAWENSQLLAMLLLVSPAKRRLEKLL